MLVAEDEDYEEYDEEDEKYDDEIWFDDMNQKILSFKHKVHKWLKEAEKSRKSDEVSRCSSKSSPKHISESNAESNSSLESGSCRTYNLNFLCQEKERCRVSDSATYGGRRINQSSSKNKFMKMKARLIKAENQNPQH